VNDDGLGCLGGLLLAVICWSLLLFLAVLLIAVFD
jgi:hypothetical protein|tara:strand:- start:887 stop:991 length:105 start_codon:yes stop_codon:yes gene_type:complete